MSQLHTITWKGLTLRTQENVTDVGAELEMRASNKASDVCLQVDLLPWSEYALSQHEHYKTWRDQGAESGQLAAQLCSTAILAQGQALETPPSANVQTALTGLPGWEKSLQPEAWNAYGVGIAAQASKVGASRAACGNQGPSVLSPNFWVNLKHDLPPAVISELISQNPSQILPALHPTDACKAWTTQVARRHHNAAEFFGVFYGPQLHCLGEAVLAKQIKHLTELDPRRESCLLKYCTKGWIPENKTLEDGPLQLKYILFRAQDNDWRWEGKSWVGNRENLQPVLNFTPPNIRYAQEEKTMDYEEKSKKLLILASKTLEAKPTKVKKKANGQQKILLGH